MSELKNDGLNGKLDSIEEAVLRDMEPGVKYNISDLFGVANGAKYCDALGGLISRGVVVQKGEQYWLKDGN